MKKIRLNELSRALNESIEADGAIAEVRQMFLTECRQRLVEKTDGPAEIYKKTGGFDGYKGVTPDEYQRVYRELHKEFWPNLDPVKQPYIPRGDVKKSTQFSAELDSRLTKIQASKGIDPSAQQTARTKQLAADVKYHDKSWTEKFWDGLKDSFDERWGWVKQYAKTAGIAALILGIVFLVIYGVRQAIEMIRTIKKTKRESRDGSQVIMTIPFKNDSQMQKFFDVIKKKMSRYVEVESVDGLNVTISCDQKYMLKHVGEIKASIAEIKNDDADAKIAAESSSRTMTFADLKRIALESI